MFYTLFSSSMISFFFYLLLVFFFFCCLLSYFIFLIYFGSSPMSSIDLFYLFLFRFLLPRPRSLPLSSFKLTFFSLLVYSKAFLQYRFLIDIFGIYCPNFPSVVSFQLPHMQSGLNDLSCSILVPPFIPFYCHFLLFDILFFLSSVQLVSFLHLISLSPSLLFSMLIFIVCYFFYFNLPLYAVLICSLNILFKAFPCILSISFISSFLMYSHVLVMA